jgi:hypothetical protein
MTNIKKRLIREKKRKDKEDEEDRLRQEKIAEKRKNPWKHEIAVCKSLLVYCELLLPKSYLS